MVYVQNGYTPVSVLLIGKVNATGSEIVIPGLSEQPMLAQMFPKLNEFKPREFPTYTEMLEPRVMTFNHYNVLTQTFELLCLHQMFPICLPLPLDNILVLKDLTVQLTLYSQNYATGEQPVHPMCSMKYNFIELNWIWPVGLGKCREIMEAKWAVVTREAPMGIGAERAQVGEVGCVVRTAAEGREGRFSVDRA
ncbi:uncharacterized protein B0H18DRAFT_1124954 [Fomitopsis serialis]|uniref:uncharacterized protein n=1 Tax=Fomitopsis serialis TaxID=139415 RepID=UPI002008D05A|nr:uncharacterized protein B0H18DRAFT_1124954 [Neoantrodia serialis]KAH9915366.1 hypothetical protein B0H18DRAFT_1124954 [Neoantrodia serialis]